MTRRKFALIYVLWVSTTALVVLWAVFLRAKATDGWTVKLRLNRYNEGVPELLILSLAVALLPLALYELDRRL